MNKIRSKKIFKKIFKLLTASEKGQVALVVVLSILSTSMVLAVGLGVLTYNEVRKLNNVVKTAQSYYVSEAGIEDALLRLYRGMNYSSPHILSVGEGSTTVEISGPIEDTTILSTGNVQNRIRKLQVELTDETSDEASFLYGIQVGDGGLFMQNESQVNGSVYSNGDIIGNNNPRITGDAFAAGTSTIDGASGNLNIDGNVQGRVLNGITVGGNAEAYQISDCTVGGNAYYDSVINNCTVGGSIFQQTYTNLAPLPMPISDSQLDTWEQEAEDGGVISGPCPYNPANGESLGPVKINCDLEISGTDTVIITGKIWVAGNITIQDETTLVLHNSFGSSSGVLIADDPANRDSSSRIEVKNEATIEGSGDPDSFVMLVSRNDSAEIGGGTTAIKPSNESTVPIYYAPHGLIELENEVNLNEATAYEMRIQNEAVVTYRSGLANLNFSVGPGGTFRILSWLEVE